ncbi:HNH endonuclease [Streptomyces sp. NPDC002076]
MRLTPGTPCVPGQGEGLAQGSCALVRGDAPGEVEDGPQIRGNHRHAARAKQVLRSPRRTHRQEAADRTVRRNPAENRKTVITDRRLAPVNTKRKELVTRLLAGRCEACGRVDEVEVHHVATLAGLGRSGAWPPWADLMAARHRKALVVCGSCHADMHGKNSAAALME